MAANPKCKKQKEFLEELKQLLEKYKAELVVEEFSKHAHTTGIFEIVVEFDYDQFNDTGSGITEPLILGSIIDKN